MRPLRLFGLIAAFSVASFLLGAGARATIAQFGDQETTTASYATVGCFTNDAAAPTIPSTTIAKTVPYLGGAIREGSAYYVYANASPGAGGPVTRVTADVRNLTAGQFLVPLSAGSYVVGGVAYGYRSGALAAAAPLAPGGYTYSVSAADGASRCRTASSSVTVDHTAPFGTDVQPINNGGGGGAGRPETGDVIAYTYSEMIDPQTISSGWTGTSRNVVVRIDENGANDLLTVWDATNTAQLPLGSVALGQDYVSVNTTFGASGTASTMLQSGTTINVTLGTVAGTTLRSTNNATALWTPSSAATDAAGNGSTTITVTETGVADRNF